MRQVVKMLNVWCNDENVLMPKRIVQIVSREVMSERRAKKSH